MCGAKQRCQLNFHWGNSPKLSFYRAKLPLNIVCGPIIKTDACHQHFFQHRAKNSKTLNVSLNSVKWILYTCFVFICGYKSRMTHCNGMKIGAVKSNYRVVPFMERLFVIISHFHGHSSSIFLSYVNAKHAHVLNEYSNYGREKNIRDFCYLSFSSFHAIANRYSIPFAAHCPVHMC